MRGSIPFSASAASSRGATNGEPAESERTGRISGLRSGKCAIRATFVLNIRSERERFSSGSLRYEKLRARRRFSASMEDAMLERSSPDPVVGCGVCDRCAGAVRGGVNSIADCARFMWLISLEPAAAYSYGTIDVDFPIK